MKIKLSSVLVEDQESALEFYTNILGFEKKMDIPMGEFRWLTVVSPQAPDEVELLLEPNANPAAKTFQGAMLEQNIPLASFAVDDIKAEYDRMNGLGVAFRKKPTAAGGVTIAVFEDTCGNLIQIYQT